MKTFKNFINEKWSAKYKKSINCSHPKGFSQKAHCAGKKKRNENVEMEMVCPDCGLSEDYIKSLNEMGTGGGGAAAAGSAGPTNVTGPQSGTDPVSATAVDMKKRKKKFSMMYRKAPK